MLRNPQSIWQVQIIVLAFCRKVMRQSLTVRLYFLVKELTV